MVTYSYTVSSDGPTTSIQEAINHVVNELSTFPTIERDIVINVGEGTYSGFTIPNNTLLPLLGGVNRLVIKAAGNYFPIIDFNFSPEDKTVGIDLGSANPNVTIEGFRIQYFAVGIRASLNCHYPIIQDCLILNNRNAGIYIEQSDESQILQNVVLNGDYGIVVRLCKNIALLHNTVFQNGAISSEKGISKSAIWLEAENDYGAGISDTGQIHLIGNIAWNTTGTALTLFEHDISLGVLVSNYNCFVKTGKSLIKLEDKQFYTGSGSRTRANYTTLNEWKQLGFDEDSISEDPKFIQPLKVRTNRNGFAIDLTLIPSSPVLGIVPSFYVDSAASLRWLPSYVDSSKIAQDILDNGRQKSGTAIGANDKKSNSGFFGQDIFSNPLDLGINKNCGVDPLLDILFKELDIWYPKLDVGYFYSNERQYYLYAKKGFSYLSDLAVTEFTVPENIVTNRPIVIRNKGKEISPSNYDIFANKIILYRNRLNIFSVEEELDIECSVARWKDDGFVYSETHYVFKMREGKTKFLLPKEYVPRGPVVITDDKAAFEDDDLSTNREYSVSFNKEYERSEIKFANSSNLIINGQFDYGYSINPSFWEGSRSYVDVPSSKYSSAFGDFVCVIPPTGYIGQTLEGESEESCLSFHYRGTGVIDYSINYFSPSSRDLGYTVTGQVTAQDSWRRKAIVIGATGNELESLIEEGTYPLDPIHYEQNNERLGEVTIKFKNNSSGTVELDAVQYELQNSPSIYHRNPFYNELTVEYETSTESSYIDNNFSIAPVRNLSNDGFLHIPELTADLFGGPKTPIITTLHEYRWPEGRETIIPWARTRGKDKLRKRTLFHSKPEPKIEILAPVLNAPQPKEIRIQPTTPIVRQGSKETIGIFLQCTSDSGNPLPYGKVVVGLSDFNLRFPGWLHKKIYGIKEQLSQTIDGRLDNTGIYSFEYLPPDENSGLWFGKTPKSQIKDSGYAMSFIETRYPVNTTNHGNVIIINDSGQMLDLSGGEKIQGFFEPVYSKNTSIINLDFPIQYNSLELSVNGRKYKEITFNVPGENEFYIDYEASKVFISGRVSEVYIRYTPIYAFVNLSNPYQIVFVHDKVFGNYTGNITVGYDFYVKLSIIVERPGYSVYLNRDFDIIVQNSLLSKYKKTNPDSNLIA